jgi:transposase
MASNQSQIKDKKVLELRKVRHFSESLKRKIVSELENCEISISEVASLYSVSVQSVYRWLHLYSKHIQTSTRMVVEMESEAKKTIELSARIAELERIIGQKQLTIDYLDKLVELAGHHYEIDLKKTFVTPPSSGSKATN